ncbi:MAG: DinB family protein [Gemmobacter sp.]
MITPEYCALLARYNRWQNRSLVAAASTLTPAARTQARGAFFGSIAGTLSHLLWGDLVWMARFDGGTRPEATADDSATAFPDWDAYRRERAATDARILLWAERIGAEELAGELFWHSRLTGRTQRQPMAVCVVHFFNHQTHHRGQAHAMLTAAGARPEPTDLVFMPADPV